jgi:hypothetical protein
MRALGFEPKAEEIKKMISDVSPTAPLCIVRLNSNTTNVFRLCTDFHFLYQNT